MDHDFYRSLGFVEHSHTWNNATQIGTATPLSSAQRSVLIRLRFPEAEYKFTKRVHWFRLANSSAPGVSEFSAPGLSEPSPDTGLSEPSPGMGLSELSLDAE